MLILEKNLLDFVESPITNSLLQAKDRVSVTISRDFEDMGFFNVIVTPPAGYSWTFVPCVEPSRAFVCGLWNTSYKKRLVTEKIFIDYFKRHDIYLKKIPAGIFHAFPACGNINKKMPLGVFWSETIPVVCLDEYLNWLRKNIKKLLFYSCKLKDRKYEDFNTPLFFAEGYTWPVNALARVSSGKGIYIGIEAKPPIPRMKEELTVLYNSLLKLESVYRSQTLDIFLARNSLRQSKVAFPYCDDEYEEDNLYPLNLIRKRVELIREINIPHFYESVNGRYGEPLKNAREQLEYLVSHNRNHTLVVAIQQSLDNLLEWTIKAKEIYGDILSFDVKDDTSSINYD